ncbi:MAG: FAD-dependent thymidylate synthase [Candidatus Aminicenantales bacterium]
MKVILAGYNLDTSVVEELRRSSPPRQDITPETLAAAYARISRDPRPVDELRAIARQEVEKARRSNQTIIFKMGHHSVAEHAVFNFDIIGLSRLALEEVEKFRLCSFTEKSQRYITLGDDFVLPEEVKRAGLEEVFVRTIQSQNNLYHDLCQKLRDHFYKKHRDLAQNPKNHPILDGWAKEDARYVVSLATQGQVGMTLNARNLELLLRRFAAKKLAELQELNRQLYAAARVVAPSLLLFTEANDFDARTYLEFEEAAARLFSDEKSSFSSSAELGRPVRLVGFSPDGDELVLAAILHTVSGLPYDSCLGKARQMTPAEKKELVKISFRHMEFYDFPLREFEHADLTFELIVSAACFAQLKRHRMATLTWQGYDPTLGVTIPESVEEVGAGAEFLEVIDRTNEVYGRLHRIIGQAADYVLTNSHRRRVLFKVNVRELYHISRLREDPTAQWDIRRLAGMMTEEAKSVMPLISMLIGGKNEYPSLYQKIFGREPGSKPPQFLK